MSIKTKALSLLTIIGLFIAAFATNIISLLVPMGLGGLKDILPPMVLLVLMLVVSIALAILLFSLLNRYLLKGLLSPLLKAPNTFSVSSFLTWTAFTVALLGSVVLVFMLIGDVDIQQMGQTTVLLGLVNAFLYGLQPGIIEELAYRWFFYGAVKKKFGYLTAVIATGLGFALIHMNQVKTLPDAGLLLLAAFAVSYMFIVIYELTGSIWPGAAVHSVWDMFTQGRGITLVNALERKEGTDMHAIDVVVNHSSSLLSGGGFGVESSIVTTIIFIVVAFTLQQIVNKNSASKI